MTQDHRDKSLKYWDECRYQAKFYIVMAKSSYRAQKLFYLLQQKAEES